MKVIQASGLVVWCAQCTTYWDLHDGVQTEAVLCRMCGGLIRSDCVCFNFLPKCEAGGVHERSQPMP